MTRLVVTLAAILFIFGFAVLTVHAIAEQGFSVASALSIFVLVLLGIGVLGALLGKNARR